MRNNLGRAGMADHASHRMVHYYGVMFEELFRDQGLSLDRLRSFLEVAEAKSIAGAAGRSATRQSQLSRQLTELEAFFGRALTKREGGKRVLTDDGERLARHAREMFAGLEDLKRGRAEASLPSFTLAAGDSVLHWLVLPRIAKVRARFSVVALPVDDVIARLHDGRVDLGIVRRDDVVGSLVSRPIGGIEHALFIPRALASREPSELPTAMQVSDRDFVSSLSREKLNIALRCETFPQVFRAVQSGHFAGLLPTLVRGELPAPRFKEVRVGGRHASKLHLAWSASLERVRPSAERVIEQLLTTLSTTAT